MSHARLDSTRLIRLRSHAKPLRRGLGEVQFGLNAEHGVVVTGLSEAEVGWLLSLNLQRTGADREVQFLNGGAAARAWGVSAPRVADLVDLLRHHDLLAPASEALATPSSARQASGNLPDREGRAPWHISILGSGRTTESIRAGVAAVHCVEVCDALLPGQHPDAVLLIVNDTVGPSDAAAWARSQIRHAPVVVDQHRVVLGPVVSPGRGPCLICLDLRRTDRDPAWPLVAAQLDSAPSEWAAPVNADPAMTAVAAGLCAALAAAMARGIRVPPGLTWEADSPLPAVTTRHWLQHPLCPVHRPEALTTSGRGGASSVEPHAAC
ncbi:MAG: hypothetical protein WBG57_11285 [Ornithinimicrobium sp.]